ncbi:hypothetical protein LBMAG53_26300 [Planctomycetota bacterium]|nr:hypothetical protein LBMAG53_26300 [Planctomycetota bacterium]
MTILYRFGFEPVDLPRLHALLQNNDWAKGRLRASPDPAAQAVGQAMQRTLDGARPWEAP